MIIEISGTKKTAEQNYKSGLWNEWTPERIKGAFRFGHGTTEDLKRYAITNKAYCSLYDTETGEFIA